MWAQLILQIRNGYKILVEKLKEKGHLEDTAKQGTIKLECILGKQGEKLWTGLFWLRTEASSRLL
jgi:hypothetical protein